MKLQSRSRVLILYANTGSGHRSVANAIHSALSMVTRGDRDRASQERGNALDVGTTECRLHNPVQNHPLGDLLDLYGPVTRRIPWFFSGAYNISNSALVCDLIGHVGYSLLRARLRRLIETTQPELVVCVHSLLMQPILKALRSQSSEYDIPLFSVVTDLASIHQSWIVPDVDRCFVPTAEVRDDMIQRGMRSERLRVSGLPVHPDYLSITDCSDRQALKLALGLHPELFTVLVMGGGAGVGRLDTIARHLAISRLPLQLIVVAGQNPALYSALNSGQREWPIPLAIFGFAHNVPALMQVSDVVVTKAGSVTIAESLACGLPIILTSVIEGQESGNVELIERAGVGRLAEDMDDIVDAVRQLITMDETSMHALRNRAHQFSAPAASLEVARDILATLELNGAIARTGASAVLETMPI